MAGGDAARRQQSGEDGEKRGACSGQLPDAQGVHTGRREKELGTVAGGEPCVHSTCRDQRAVVSSWRATKGAAQTPSSADEVRDQIVYKKVTNSLLLLNRRMRDLLGYSSSQHGSKEMLVLIIAPPRLHRAHTMRVLVITTESGPSLGDAPLSNVPRRDAGSRRWTCPYPAGVDVVVWWTSCPFTVPHLCQRGRRYRPRRRRCRRRRRHLCHRGRRPWRRRSPDAPPARWRGRLQQRDVVARPLPEGGKRAGGISGTAAWGRGRTVRRRRKGRWGGGGSGR